MTDRLFSCYFDSERNGYYPRMARILAHTARRHCRGWDVVVEEIRSTQADRGTTAANTKKLDWWAERVVACEDGDRVALIDADCVILGDIGFVWGGEFDVAITRRHESAPFPYNGGVVFVRVSERTRCFMETWAAVNRRLRDNRDEHAKWRRKYGGMNQAALGALLESGLADPLAPRLYELPCSEWNCEDSTWRDYSPDVTRIVHYKSGLRIAALGIGASKPQYSELVRLWRRLDREVNG